VPDCFEHVPGSHWQNDDIWAHSVIMAPTGLQHLTGTFLATPGTVPAVRRAFTELCADAGATDEQVASERLAVSEALTNAVRHAYRGGMGSVHVSAHLAAGELWVLIADDGCGLLPVTHSPGLGMGLALIAEVCEEFSLVNRSSGGIELRMRFSIGPDPGPDDQSRGSDSSASRPARPVFSTTT
jgi:anti-sigma regulatory factor (Ser/Thr protein kinase)